MFSLCNVGLICSTSSFDSLFLFSCVPKHFSFLNVKGSNSTALLLLTCLKLTVVAVIFSADSFVCGCIFLALSYSLVPW